MSSRARRSSLANDATDLTDEQCALALLVVTLSPKGNHLTAIDRCAIVNKLLDKRHTGCRWRMLPTDVLLMSSVYFYFDPWSRDGTFVNINDMLRKLVRHALDCDSELSINVLAS